MDMGLLHRVVCLFASQLSLVHVAPTDGGMAGLSCPQWLHTYRYGWWRGVVGNTFRLKRSYSTPGPVSTVMGDCLRAGKPSRCEACQLGRLSLLPSVGW